MTKYTRLTGKVFGSSATATGDDPEIGQFGSALAGTYNGTTDISLIQSLPAWQKGFIGCVTPNTQFPPLPEMTGFGKVLSHQICYLLQQGVAEWDSGTTYYINGWCSYNGSLYISKADENINNLPTNTTYWDKFTGGFSRNYGEIVTSSLPIIGDNTLHLADGSLLSATNYPEFVSYISSIYTPPTVGATYYAWENISDGVSTYVYTESLTASPGDIVYKYQLTNYQMQEYGSISYEIGNDKVVSDGKSYGRSSTADKTVYDFSQKYFITEADWQATYTTYGECGKYVYDSTNNTVRIPLYNSYFTNTVNPQKLGNLTEASLPNITGTFGGAESYNETQWNTGAFYSSDQNTTIGGSSNRDADLTHFDASRSSSVYKDSATTVNTQSIKQLVYIVVAK